MWSFSELRGGTAYQRAIGYMLLAEKLALPTKCDSILK
jgi:hypothetical protein